MNTDYVIQIKTKRDRTWSYRKEKNGWSQTAPTGIVRQLSGDQPGLSISLQCKRRKE